MNEMKEAVGNWREAKQFSPADENDFLRWLDKADTEEKLFSRLTFWFTFRGLPADQNQRYHLVQERARELRLWNGLELKLRRWQDRVADEYEQIGKEAFAARIGEDYADYINSLTDPEAAPQQAAPEPETAKPAGVQAWSARELSEMVLPPIRHVVEGLLPMGMGVLVAKPKLGKSWMVLDLCLAVAQGEPFLGFPTRQHGTLYLALEDGKSRMQTRLRRLLEGRPAPRPTCTLCFRPSGWARACWKRWGSIWMPTRTSIWSASILYPRSSPRQSPLKMPTMPTTTTWAG